MPVAAVASVQPNASGSAMQSRPEAAARVCCRMLTEGGKIHLQSEPVSPLLLPLLSLTLAPLQPFRSLRPGWLSPRRGDFHTPRKGWAARTDSAWPELLPHSAPRTRQPHSSRQGPAHIISPIPLASMGLVVVPGQEGEWPTGMWMRARRCVLWAMPG